MKRILLSLAFLMTSSLALASGGGGGDGGGAASSILKLDPLVVNLSGGHFLQDFLLLLIFPLLLSRYFTHNSCILPQSKQAFFK